MNIKFDPVSGKELTVFLHYSISSVIGMLAISSAGIIDGLFLGNFVGAGALAAVTLTLPLVVTLIGIAIMLSSGGSVISGKKLGEGNTRSASSVFTKTLVTILGFSLFTTAFGMIFIDSLIFLLGANETLTELVRDYLLILLLFVPFHLGSLCLSYFIRVDGRPVLASAVLLLSAVLNILLDWLFIAEWGLGINGAAWATGIAETIAFMVLLPQFILLPVSLRFEWVNDGWKQIQLAVFNGFSEFVNEISVGVVIFLFNWIMIKRLGMEGVAAFAIVNYLFFAGLMVCYGVSDSLQPIVSKNFGAKKPGRISFFMRLAGVTVFSIGCLSVALLGLASGVFINLFLKPDEQATMKIAAEFISFFWPAFLFSGINITVSAYFTAMQKPIHSVTLALSHSLILPAIFLLTLPSILGNKGIYLSIPLAEMCTCVLALFLFFRNQPSKLISC